MRSGRRSRVGSGAIATIAAALLCAGPAPARAQDTAVRPIPEIEDFQHDGVVGEWRSRPMDRVLAAGDRTPQALVWVGRTARGLVVAAEIRAGLAVDGSATLRIGLAGPDSLRLPPIGWGHQFGDEVVPDSAGCEAFDFAAEDPEPCRRWVVRQKRIRARLPALFEREWRVPIAFPDSVVEVRAGAAFAGLAPAVRDRLRPLAPRGLPRALARPIAGTAGGVGLEVLIPWGSFPPVPAPDLDAVRLRVDWVRPEGADAVAAAASTGEVRAGERVDAVTAAETGRSWVALGTPRPLSRPLEHRITPCEYGVEGLLIPGGESRFGRPASPGAVAYMIPEGSGDLRALIVLDNEAAGYQYQPDPEAISPAAYEVSYGVLDIGRGERLCAPELALARAGARVTPPDWTRTGAGDPFERQVDLRQLEVRRLDDGDLLVKSGPRVRWSYYGSGQCGACPRVALDLFRVSEATGAVTHLFRLLETVDPGASDVELEVSDDWGVVTVYRSVTRWDADPPEVTWRAVRHCLVPAAGQGEPEAFEPCGEEADVPEPPRRLRGRYGVEP